MPDDPALSSEPASETASQTTSDAGHDDAGHEGDD
jgi:hypothetical protein